jgi:hypothetical protein
VSLTLYKVVGEDPSGASQDIVTDVAVTDVMRALVTAEGGYLGPVTRIGLPFPS